ncbi:transpeptidase [Desulfosarcina ovata subsp. ovata]|uniref:Transpeptidase n=1 Tax=Desulfosarcina ovata subsp. ovata TaxID=2752305 RepID=A0A5K8AH80_9BACT|nr:transpeptidase [Desulfosarcina ovata subsp. ovata]
MLTVGFTFGCSHRSEDFPVGLILSEANNFCTQGNYEASLAKYATVIEKEPETADRVLFEMGIIYAHPRNPRKSYQKALECFRKIIGDVPDSDYRRDSQMLMLQIQNVIIKDHLIAEQQAQVETYRRKIKFREHEIITLQKKIETLEQKIFELRTEPVDKILIEKKRRRLTLISKGEVIKTYRIALGGNPIGPKEREGDNKTPEGNYTIESRNRHSGYHLSLRISYPNERDKKHAKELGVSPGGDIMIHGVKDGLSWVGEFHTEIDWTQGCIAVTNKEIEEIARLVPDGTPVEIRP